jgi:hypothetical protein
LLVVVAVVAVVRLLPEVQVAVAGYLLEQQQFRLALSL